MRKNTDQISSSLDQSPESKLPSRALGQVSKWVKIALAVVIGSGTVAEIISQSQKDKAPQNVVAPLPEERGLNENVMNMPYLEQELRKEIADPAVVQALLSFAQNSKLKSGEVTDQSLDFSAFGKEYQGQVQSIEANQSGGINIIAKVENGTVRLFQVGNEIYAHVSVWEDGKHQNFELRTRDGEHFWQEQVQEGIAGGTGDYEHALANPPTERDGADLKNVQDGFEFPEQAECTRESLVYHFQITQTLVDTLGSIDAVLALLEGSVAYGQETLRNSDPRFRYANIEFSYTIVDIEDEENISYGGSGNGDTFSYFSYLLTYSTSPNVVKDAANSSPTSFQVIICLNLKNRLGASKMFTDEEPISGIYYHEAGVQDDGLGYNHRTLIHESPGHNKGLFHENAYYTQTLVTNVTTGDTQTVWAGTVMGVGNGNPINIPARTFSNPDTTYNYLEVMPGGDTLVANFVPGDAEHNSVDTLAKYYLEDPGMHDDLLHAEDVDPPSAPELNVEYLPDSMRVFVENPDTNLTYYWSNGMVGPEITVPYPPSSYMLTVVPRDEACNCPGESTSLLITDVENIENPERDITIYPNPSSGPITFEGGESLQGKNLRCLLFDMQGRVVHAENFEGNRFSFSPEVPTGLYLLRVLDRDNNQVLVDTKVVRQ